MLSSLRLLCQVVSHFPGFPSNPCLLRQNPYFMRQNTVLPWFLRAVLRAGGGGGGGGGGGESYVYLIGNKV